MYPLVNSARTVRSGSLFYGVVRVLMCLAHVCSPTPLLRRYVYGVYRFGLDLCCEYDIRALVARTHTNMNTATHATLHTHIQTHKHTHTHTRTHTHTHLLDKCISRPECLGHIQGHGKRLHAPPRSPRSTPGQERGTPLAPSRETPREQSVAQVVFVAA